MTKKAGENIHARDYFPYHLCPWGEVRGAIPVSKNDVPWSKITAVGV
jgi:hypothetical protein